MTGVADNAGQNFPLIHAIKSRERNGSALCVDIPGFNLTLTPMPEHKSHEDNNEQQRCQDKGD